MNKKVFAFTTSFLVLVFLGLFTANLILNQRSKQLQAPESTPTDMVDENSSFTREEEIELDSIQIGEDENEFEKLRESANQL